MKVKKVARHQNRIETDKANGLEPYKYLTLFEEFPISKTPEEIFNLLPMNIYTPDLKKETNSGIIWNREYEFLLTI